MKTVSQLLLFVLVATLNRVCQSAGFAYFWQTYDDNSVLVGLPPPVPDAFTWPPPPGIPPAAEEPSGSAASGEGSREKEDSGESSVVLLEKSEEGGSEGEKPAPEGESGEATEPKESSGEESKESGGRESEETPESGAKEEATPAPAPKFKGFPPRQPSPFPVSYIRKLYGTYNVPPPPLPPLQPATRVQYVQYRTPLVLQSPLLPPSALPYLPLRAQYATLPVTKGAAPAAPVVYGPLITPNITTVLAPPPPVVKAPRITAISPKVAAASALRLAPPPSAPAPAIMPPFVYITP